MNFHKITTDREEETHANFPFIAKNSWVWVSQKFLFLFRLYITDIYISKEKEQN